MQGFPPAADKRVDVSNGYRYPQLRWVVQHLREIQPTQNIRRGAAALGPARSAHGPGRPAL